MEVMGLPHRVEHHDVLIVGAGISGISAAVQLQRALPDKRYAILEKREALGGTWDLFRFPGVRSDSDMFTLGFQFKPWEHPKAIADGGTIRDYVREAAVEHGIESRIRYRHRVVSAAWDTDAARWTLRCDVGDGVEIEMTANFVHFASGYYSYENPYAPEFPGQQRFSGELIHPQHWPEQLDYTDKRVVVIGSGATAMTLVPALAQRAAHVTMLQRSPSYVISLPAEDDLANALRKVLPSHLAYGITRASHLAVTYASYEFLRRQPRLSRKLLKGLQARQLPKDYPLDVHFNPRYDPWDERLCIVPDGDLFKALSAGDAEIVTGDIETFTETGIELAGGQVIDADIIVSATGLNLELLGGTNLTVDGQDVNLAEAVFYKGVMLSGVPNLSNSFGYLNASWTLKADLVAAYLVRLLEFMDARGYDEVLPVPPPADEPRRPLVLLQSGYFRRAVERLPKQGSRDPWQVHQNWFKDTRLLRHAPVADQGVRFFRRDPAKRPDGDISLAISD